VTSKTDYCVYKLQSPDNKIYIGATKNIKRRINDHKNGNKCTKLQDAIKLFGFHSFELKIEISGLTKEEAFKKENELILALNSIYPNGYNLTTGGLNCQYSEISKNKMSEKNNKIAWNKGIELSEKHKLNLSKSHKNIKQSPETIEKRVSKLRGKPRSAELKNILSDKMKGRKFSDETLQRMSIAQKKRFSKDDI
jgi:group I intron endonuclease